MVVGGGGEDAAEHSLCVAKMTPSVVEEAKRRPFFGYAEKAAAFAKFALSNPHLSSGVLLVADSLSISLTRHSMWDMKYQVRRDSILRDKAVNISKFA